ncbi:MAG TPA: antibiotic biosynthesis monooxygenase [Noviherbaspirillum sp.]|nr:antibiotic biosynthesis monooxygenase [Noviherbaspirillum sp.]
MFAVAFEVLPSETGYQRYLDIAASLRPKLDLIDGFISIERFRSLTHPGWILSLSLWRDEAALVQWRRDGEHHAAQAEGRQSVFDDYRIRVIRMVDMPQDGQGPLVSFYEHPAAISAEAPKQFQSLVDSDKRIALMEFTDASSACAWQKSHAERSAPPARVLCGVTMRDYGLFERGQAPQYFPEAMKR